MQHHLRDRSKWSIAVQTVRPSATSINKEEASKWAGTPQSTREGKGGPCSAYRVVTMASLKGNLSSEVTDG